MSLCDTCHNWSEPKKPVLAGDCYSLRLPLLFGSGLDDLGSIAFDEVVSDGLDSDEPSDFPADLAELPSELAVVVSDFGSDDVDSDLLSDLVSDVFLESDAADFLYDSLR